MNAGIAPFVLLAATVGLMLGMARPRMALTGGGVFIGSALIGFLLPDFAPVAVLFAGLFVNMIAIAILIYFPPLRWQIVVVPISLSAGLCLGMCAAATSTLGGVATGLTMTLLAIPVHWIAQRKFVILVKVVASWMIAIASLSLFVSLVPTPGYKPDHME